MAQSINYASIAPSSNTAADGAKAVSSNFLYGGHKLSSKKGSKAPTPNASTPVAGTSTNAPKPPLPTKRTGGPQPLRLPPGKLFFGYEFKPLRRKDESGEPVPEDEVKPKFQGQGQTLRAKKQRATGTDSGAGSGVNSDAETNPKSKATGSGKG
jgi:ubiquitin fusion degradation protein 1